MNNLKPSWELSSKLQLQSEDEVLQLAVLDMERNLIFFASSANVIYSFNLHSSQDGGSWSRISEPPEAHLIDLEPGDFVTALDHLMEKEALIVGTSYGLLLLFSVDDNATEIVGRVEGGVKCVSPSPDGDLLGVVTGFRQILMMTHDWDVVYEMAIDDLPVDIDVHEPTFSSNYSFENLLSWRGDGKFFATLSKAHDSSSSYKKLKVWERDSGVLHSVSESKAFVGAALDWMPSGAKIAAVHDRKDEKKCPSIVFYERNGLERSSFSLDEETDGTVEILKWNCNSDLLATVVRGEKYDFLKIWFFSNNHWYLKQDIRFLSQDRVQFLWDQTSPLQLICWTLGGEFTVYNFVWASAVMDNSTALVIDGSKILITPLSLTLIPPPLYLFNLKFPSAVKNFAFFSRSSRNLLAVSLSDGRLCIAEIPALSALEELEGKEFHIEACSLDLGFGSLIHLAFLDSHLLLTISHLGLSHSSYYSTTSSGVDKLSGYYLQEIEFTCSEDHIPDSLTCSGWLGEICNQISLESLVLDIVPNTLSKLSACIQLSGGRIIEYLSKLHGPRGGSLQKCDGMSFSSSCPWMALAPVGGSVPEKFLLFGLDNNSRLHANGKVLCNNCNSFCFYSSSADQVTTHLILSTKQDLLFIIDIGDIFKGELEAKFENFMPTAKKNNNDERNCINIWERGAKIVGVLHGDESTVLLQTIRGNLECVYPRKLVLTSIINALVHKRFRDALFMVRRHRIDFNVIIDHRGWQDFLQYAGEFVKQVNSLSHITEFVCSVKKENVMETVYKNHVCLPSREEVKVINSGDLVIPDSNKVSSVLLALRRALEQHVEESPVRELCILTTLARNEPPAIAEALERIKVIRETELSGSDSRRMGLHPSAEECLKHLLWLSDSEAVFDAALGLYDLNLAAIVALNSQKDPKEFLPYLQELECMQPAVMRYNIDLKLKRYENALQHIISAGDAHYDDCLRLMKNNPQLFPLGLQLITDPDKRNEVLEAWGDHLSQTRCFEDAATTYLSCSCLDKALKAYRSGGNWNGVLTVGGLLKLSKEETMKLAHELYEELQALGKLGDAAKIALEYCGDVSAGISLLVSAREWEEALRIGFLHRRDDLILEVKNASLECANTLVSEYEEGLEKVGKYLTRYLAVRQRRLLLAAKLQSEERPVDDVDDETASEASSSFSGMSAYTTSTGTRKGSAASISSAISGKGRRQRHKGKIRAGSPDEEMALVEHLKGMSLSSAAKRELKSLLICLVMLRDEDVGRKLQRVGGNYQLSQMAAVKLADDAASSGIVNEHVYSLERYIQITRTELQNLDAFSWQLKVLL